MADTRKPCLTVLGGPSAGTRFVFQEGFQEISVGSDEECSFRLQLPGVSATHARIVIDAGGAVTIHDTGSENGLHVNDNRVPETGTALRNGDIVWLGTPGDADVVMLQCILPRVSAAAPAVPSPPAPTPPPPTSVPSDEPVGVLDETDSLALEADTLFGAEAAGHPTSANPEASVPLDQEFVAAGEPAPAIREPVTFDFDEHETREVASSPAEISEDETLAEPPAFVVPEDSSTVAIDPAEMTGEAVESMPEPTVVMSAEPEATMALPADLEPTVFASLEPEPTLAMPMEPEPPVAEPPPPRAKAAPVHAPPKAPPAAPPKPAAAPPPAAASSPSASGSRSTTSARPAASARPAPSSRPRVPTADRSTPPPARAVAGKSSAGLYAGLGVAVLVLGGGGWAVWRFVLSTPADPAVATAAATPVPAPRAPVGAPPTLAAATPAPVEAIASPEAAPSAAPVATPVAATPSSTVAAVPVETPAPTPSPRRASPTPPPPAAATGPSAEALRAQQTAAQVASLLGQAEAALAARQYDQAIAHLDGALSLDPQNGKASADRAVAVAQRDAARKKFVPGRTVVATEKSAEGLAGFDSVAVQKAPDFLGRIEFEMTPASGVRAGDPYTLRFFLINEGKKTIRIQGVTVNTVVNGAGTGTPVPPAAKEVAPQQRARIGEVSGSWREGTTSWSAEVLITANKGDSLKSQIAWR